MSQSIPSRMVQYFRESFQELRRVVWPTRKQAFMHSFFVIVMSVTIAVFLAGLDIVFAFGMQRLLSLKGL